MFRGVTHLALDNKGRLAIPAKHREASRPTATGSSSDRRPQPLLLLYPLAGWEPIQAAADGACRASTRGFAALQRLLVGHADDVEIDGAGRILVPPALRQFASLDKRVVLVGQGKKFELWDERAGWSRQRRRSRSRPAACRRSSTVFRCRMSHGDHVPVLLEEAVAALRIRPDGMYVDATFGRGGHSRLILESLGPTAGSSPRPRSRRRSGARTWSDPRFVFHRAWFSELPAVLDRLGIALVDGVLLDLGVSSPQIDDPERGFSFRARRAARHAHGPFARQHRGGVDRRGRRT